MATVQLRASRSMIHEFASDPLLQLQSVCAPTSQGLGYVYVQVHTQKAGKAGESVEQIISQADRSCPKGHITATSSVHT